MFKKIVALTVVALFVSVSSLASSPTTPNASATVYQDKVSVCHRTDAPKNPYESISVSSSAVDGMGNGDHFKNHTGPVAYSEAFAAQLKSDHKKWGDIIPPTAFHPLGLNWTPIGQAVYYNKCAYPKTATANIGTIPATCSRGEQLVYGSITNATFSGTATGTYGPAEYSVIATAANDSLFFINQLPQTTVSFTGTLSGRLTGTQCDIQATVTPVTEFTNLTCDKAGSYTIPKSTGVDYFININDKTVVIAAGTYYVAAGTTINIIASAQSGYTIGQQKTLYSYTFTTPIDCPQTPEKPADIVSTNTSSSANCSTKLLTTIVTTSTTTYTQGEGEWIAGEPVIKSTSSSRTATTAELSACANDENGVVLGSSTNGPVARLPYTSGNTTLATLLTLSALAAVVMASSLAVRRIVSRRV